MIKIGILRSKHEKHNLSLYYGYWKFFYKYQNALNKKNIEINFYKKINDFFLKNDYIILNSRFFEDSKDIVEDIKLIYEKNKNIIWWDMRDSAGTTQFEVMPYIKKYVKKQIYKDLNIYCYDMYGGRYYSDYYHKNFSVTDSENYKLTKLNEKYFNKIILAWNIGVSDIFEYKNLFSYINKYKSTFLSNFLSYDNFNFKEKLRFKSISSQKIDILSKMNLNISRPSVGYQRTLLDRFFKQKNYKNSIFGKRISKLDYFKKLNDTKIVINAYGWGEVCYREFEATRCGAAFLTADMENISTWPNIYQKDKTYAAYNLDFSNLEEKIYLLLNNHEHRNFLVKNSQEELKKVENLEGKKYFLDVINKILN
tara:strand:- start:47 stop:1147 length:1101 start_codon:yes stop_codon:yes gene_type:complete